MDLVSAVACSPSGGLMVSAAKQVWERRGTKNNGVHRRKQKMEFQKPTLSSKQLTMQAMGKCDFLLSTPIYNSHSHLTQDALQTPRLCL